MNLLFVHGSTRWIHDSNGALYTSTTFNENIWKRYHKHCDVLSILLRTDSTIYPENVAMKKYNRIDITNKIVYEVPDVYAPAYNILNPFNIRKIEKTVEIAVKKADYIIIRSFGNVYTIITERYARKYNKPYMVEVTGFEFESDWYHSIKGKIVALPREYNAKRMLHHAKFATYVTNNSLQRRYPCGGESIGCSDVEIVIDQSVPTKRAKRIQDNEIITIGTSAALDVGWKGQINVLKVLASMSKEERTKYRYKLIGAGDPSKLRKLSEELGIQDIVEVIGTIPHSQVYGWLDGIDLYIQSSYMEGLCRSIVEAMSRGCPVICSDVGGNYELVNKEYLFKPGDTEKLFELIRKCSSKEVLQRMSEENFRTSLNYEIGLLDKKRDAFLTRFIGR